jgi:sporadic carbohydrate cluster 2OG-Fe(II) oxygenase
MFFTKEEAVISEEFIQNGYIKKKTDSLNSLDYISNIFIKNIFDLLSIKKKYSPQELLNNFHNLIELKNLNNFRLDLINRINSVKDFREKYFLLGKKYLDIIVGNELVMQNRINLSIQIPNDDSSLLPIHSDTWSGDSPFEAVLWIPLVNCYSSKSMYILPPKHLDRINNFFSINKNSSSEEIFNEIKNDVEWINIDYGEILIFNQNLPHGNVVNNENETRWSMNCRFKSIFSPYGDKKIGEFFEPITLRAISKIGMNYKFPNET